VRDRDVGKDISERRRKNDSWDSEGGQGQTIWAAGAGITVCETRRGSRKATTGLEKKKVQKANMSDKETDHYRGKDWKFSEKPGRQCEA